MKKLKASLAMAYGCPFEGKIPSEKVLGLAKRLEKLGAQELALCDTAGMAGPAQIGSLIATVQEELPNIELSLHLHARKKKGPANAWAGFEAGIRVFEGSIGGLGGCPFIPNAIGNMATEDMVKMFQDKSIRTGVELEKLTGCTQLIQAIRSKYD